MESLHIARLLSGSQRIRSNRKTFLSKNPTSEQRLMIEEMSVDYTEEMAKDGVFTKAELAGHLIKQGMWRLEDDRTIEQLKKDIVELKVQIFQTRFKTDQQKIYRRNLKEFSKKLENLSSERSKYDYLSIEGLILAWKAKLSFAVSLYRLDGSLYWPDWIYMKEWNRCDPDLDNLFSVYLNSRLTQADIRGIARSNDWGVYWRVRESLQGGLFNKPLLELSDEQKALVQWSQLYDNLRQMRGADKLPDYVLADDDMIDGYLTLRERESSQESGGSLGLSDKIMNGDEIFLPVDNAEDAKRVYNLNSPEAKAKLKKKMAQVDKAGVLSEVETEFFQEQYREALVRANQLKRR